MIDSLKETFKLGEKMEIKVMSDLEIEADREKYIASNKDQIPEYQNWGLTGLFEFR